MTCPSATHGRETDYINHGCLCPEARDKHRKLRKKRALHMLEYGPMLQPALPTCLRLRALTAAGYSGRDVAAHSTILSAQHVNQLRSHENKKVTPRIAVEVDRLYRLLSGTPGVNKRAMGHGRRHGYLDPLQLEAPGALGPVIDGVAIDRALHGERVPMSPEERAEAVRVGVERGLLPYQIGRALHMSGDRVRDYLAGYQPKKRGAKKKAA